MGVMEDKSGGFDRQRGRIFMNEPGFADANRDHVVLVDEFKRVKLLSLIPEAIEIR